MCLATTKEETEKFRKKNKDKEFIWGYKIYTLESLNLYPVYYHRSKKIRPGEIKSNRSRLSFDKRDLDDWYDEYVCNDDRIIVWEINKGIQVYKYKHDAKRHCNLDEKVVRVKCFMSDFVAYDELGKQVVFRKIYLDEKEFDRAIEGKQNVSTS